MIKAIETNYAGCRFRSRTEARWAVFFDALGVRWEYEREGYELPSGRYLPDFWLPDWNTWFEIKGEPPTDDEWTLAEELAVGTGFPVVFGVSAPGGQMVWGRCLQLAICEAADDSFHLAFDMGRYG